MQQYFILFLGALLGALAVSAIATPAVRALAPRWGAMDKPGERKIHASPIPRLGGLAIWIALWASALVVLRMVPSDATLRASGSLPELACILGGATIILFLGLTDDSRGEMRPLTKLVGEFVATTVLVAFGIRLRPFGIAALDIPLTYLWVMGLTNALNLLDNMDGLSAGAASIASTFIFLLAVQNGQALVALLAAALIGACLGFLIYNYNPATIFMGDTGSLTLGFMLAVLGMKLQIHDSAERSIITAALVLVVPIFDTTFVMWRRLSEGRRVMQGGKDHTSHRLVNLGLNQRQAVWALYIACFVAGVAALIASQVPPTLVVTEIVALAVVVIGAGTFLGRVRPQA